MKKKNWFVLLITLGYLIGCTTGTSDLMATRNSSQGMRPSQTEWSQVIAFDMATTTPELAKMIISHWTSTSPDGRWIAEGVLAFDKDETCCGMFYTGLILRSVDGKTQWTIVDEWAEQGLGWRWPQPIRWSKDGSSFYYTNKPRPDGCGLFVNGSDLQKVDLDSGKVVEVLPSSGLSIALSPDETAVAFRGYGRRGLVLRDLLSGQEREISVEPGKDYAAKIVWSPDSKSLAVTLAIGACDTVDDGESTSILLVEADSLMVQTVLWEDKRYLVAEEWLDPGRIVLKDPQGNKWIWDVKSNEIIQQ